MARPKRSSVILQKAEKREAGLQSISSDLDLGNGLTLEAYSALIEGLRSQIATYNSDLSNLDDQSRQIKETEQQLRNLSEQMLLGVAAKYGKNSGEYGKAGGVPKSERRRPIRKQATENGSSSSPTLTSSTPTTSEIAASATNNGSSNGKIFASL